MYIILTTHIVMVYLQIVVDDVQIPRGDYQIIRNECFNKKLD